ncbi:Uncharacterized protein TCM_044486 [Theobroma cacao]|uniref:GST C-terminal domain-containing protein n=1 Tax=Theobroma cacao TaxID=3641 RepID=A0A061FQN1_THECC|nr:Uncharacterized protein TCM_044486 [Theobroma cacao]
MMTCKLMEKLNLALEKLSKDHAGRYATGDEVYMADLFLAPQIDFATKTFKVDMVMSLPELVTINMCVASTCMCMH